MHLEGYESGTEITSRSHETASREILPDVVLAPDNASRVLVLGENAGVVALLQRDDHEGDLWAGRVVPLELIVRLHILRTQLVWNK